MQSMPGSPEPPRYFQLILQQDLLGGWSLIRESGQQGTRGSLRRGRHPCCAARDGGLGGTDATVQLAPFGTVLEPGHMMLSGSFTRPVWANPGDTLHADFGPLGSVAVQFV